MPTVKNLRFQKFDQYGSAVFISNAQKEPKAFKKLKKYYEQLAEKFPETYLPIYHSETLQYSTLKLKTKFQECMPKKLERNDVYNIRFEIRSGKNSETGKVYVNCVPKKCKLVSKAVVEGSLVDLDSDSDSEPELPSPTSLSRSIVKASNEDEFGSRGW